MGDVCECRYFPRCSILCVSNLGEIPYYITKLVLRGTQTGNHLIVIQVYAPISNAEEAEVEWFYEDLQDLLDLTPPKNALFIIRDWNAKVGSQKHLG